MADEPEKPPTPPAPAAPKPAAPAARPAAPAVAKPAAGGEAHVPKAAPPTGPPDPPPPADAVVPAFITSLQQAVTGTTLSLYLGDWTVIVPAPYIVEAATHLRDAPEAAFDYCSDLTA